MAGRSRSQTKTGEEEDAAIEKKGVDGPFAQLVSPGQSSSVT